MRNTFGFFLTSACPFTLVLYLAGCGAQAGPSKDTPVASAESPVATVEASAPSATVPLPPVSASPLDSAQLTATKAAPESALPELIQIFETGKSTIEVASPVTACPGFDPAWKPGGAWLEDYVRDGEHVTIHGGARDTSDVAAIACLLALSSVFTDVSVGPSSSQNGSRFELRFRFPGAPHDQEKLVSFKPPRDAEKPAKTAPWVIQIEQVSLVAIITGPQPRAMFADANGVGRVLHLGDTLGSDADAFWTLRSIFADRVVLTRLETSGKTRQKVLTLKR